MNHLTVIQKKRPNLINVISFDLAKNSFHLHRVDVVESNVINTNVVITNGVYYCFL